MLEKEIVIVGDGIQGTGIAMAFAEVMGAENLKDKLAVVGTEGYLGGWNRVVRSQGMQKLISPYFCQVGSAVRQYPDEEPPTVEDFNGEAWDLINKYGLEACHIQSHASDLKMDQEASYPYEIRLKNLNESIRSKTLILALGYGVPKIPPLFVPYLQAGDKRIFHSQHLPEDLSYKDKRVLIVGRGRTGNTLNHHIKQQGGRSTVVCKTAERQSVDYFSRYVLPDDVERFRNSSIEQRLKELQAYWDGRIPRIPQPEEPVDMKQFDAWEKEYYESLSEANRALHDQYEAERKEWEIEDERLQTQVAQADFSGEQVKVVLQNTASNVEQSETYDLIILATGYLDYPQESSLIPTDTRFIKIDGRGVYPEMDNHLQIKGRPGLFGVGGLSLLRQGPAARDIPIIPAHVQAIMTSQSIRNILTS